MFNPFLIFWFYYLIGPIIGIENVNFIQNNELIFKNEDSVYIYAIHLLSYFTILPILLYLSKNNLYVAKIKINNIIVKVSVYVLLILIFVLFLYHLNALYGYFFLRDAEKAILYIEWLDSNRIITITIFTLVLFEFINKNLLKYLIAFLIIIIDIIMGRRQLMILFFYYILKNISKAKLFFFIISIGLISSLRHGVDDISLDFYNFIRVFFAESYMIMLSSASHSYCNININLLIDFFHFERFTENCRVVQFAAGGFSSRFHYSIYFGIFSILIYSFFFIFAVILGNKYIKNSIINVFNSIIFVSLFILYRDDLGNSILFLYKYTFVLIVFSYIYRVFSARVRS